MKTIAMRRKVAQSVADSSTRNISDAGVFATRIGPTVHTQAG
jgi:hypothetical protein